MEIRAALLSQNKEVCRALRIPFVGYDNLQGRYKDRLQVYAFLVVDGLSLLS